jgi:ATP-dependent DNA ligase
MLPVRPPVAPMLARLQSQIPDAPGWVYEPKWDGFRAIVFRDGKSIHIASRNELPLERYFPELVDALPAALEERCVVDGEIVIAGDKGLDFDALQLRIHPAASRVKMLSQTRPAVFIAFDILARGDLDLRSLPYIERQRHLLEAVRPGERVRLTPQTEDHEMARNWFQRFEGAGFDGVVAKPRESAYVSGERLMVKVKHQRTVDCVVGGYRVGAAGASPGSLLLGLYDGAGVLHYAGHTSSFSAAERVNVMEKIKPFEGGESFGMGRAPGGPSRWSHGRETTWVTLRPELVCEVSFDHLQGNRFRHASRFLRWRPDKSPQQCTYDQLEPPGPFALDDVLAMGR